MHRYIVTRLLLALGLFAWLTYMVLSGQPNIALHVYPATLRVHLLYVGLGLFYAAFLAFRRRLPNRTPVEPRRPTATQTLRRPTDWQVPRKTCVGHVENRVPPPR